MKKIYFTNAGIFDVSAMLTFGISVKESSDAIGYFGTGLKYAIAIILRLGGLITIETGGELYKFTINKKSIRGKEFNIVQVNGVDTGFTTHLGINWEPWQAYREIYCNCIDEGGSVSKREKKADTVICIESDQIVDAYNNRDRYFLSGKPLYSTNYVEVHNGGRPYYYYKGVAVADSDESEFSYNILHDVDLTEDRTAKYVDYDIRYKIAAAIQSCPNDGLLKALLSSKEKGDKQRAYRKENHTSDEFIAMCRNLLNTDNSIPNEAMAVVAHHDSKNGNWPTVSLTSVQESMLDRANTFLSGIGIDNYYPIKVVKGLGDGCMGRAHNGVIYLSLIPFELGTKQVASTVLEEFVHLKHECADFDRKMQSWLFDKVLSIGEELNGEPL